MVVILPTFGFTTSHAYFDNLIRNGNLNWECIFLPDSGAFFVNYVITSAIIGSSLELIRLGKDTWTPWAQGCISYLRILPNLGKMRNFGGKITFWGVILPILREFLKGGGILSVVK